MIGLAPLIGACAVSPPAPWPLAPVPTPLDASGSVRFGRYVVSVPPEGVSWQTAIVRCGEAAVTVERWAGAELDGDDRAAAFDAAWADVVRRAAGQPAPPWWDGDGVVLARETLRAGRRGATLFTVPGRYAPLGMRQWEAAVDAGDALVRVKVAGTDVRAEALRDRLDRVVDALRTPEDDGFGTADWLYAGPVALDLSPAGGEEASAGYRGPLGRLRVSARADGVPNDASLRERAERTQGGPFRPNTRGVGKVDLVRSRDRRAGGLAGQEVVAVARPRGAEPTERTHTWEHDGDHLFLTIELAQSPAPSGEADPRWDPIVDSARRVR